MPVLMAGAGNMTESRFVEWIETAREEIEAELLDAGYTYRDIEDARDAMQATDTESGKDLIKVLCKRLTKYKLAELFYIVGRLEGLVEGFRRGYHEAVCEKAVTR